MFFLRKSMQEVASLGKAWLLTRVLGKKNPIFAEWNITFRCPFKCKYCGANEVSDIKELDTEEAKEFLEELYKIGIRWITFGGGEPLVRTDIEEILHYSKRLGFRVYLSTTGLFIERLKNIEKCVDHINLSFDGPEEVQDEVRGVGSYKRLFEVVKYCKEKKISTSFLCVISSSNIGSIEFVIEKAKEVRIPVMFQPATLHLDSSTSPNPIAPPVEEYRKVVEKVILAKKNGAWIRNSLSGLKYLANWPNQASIWCPAGRLSITIEPDGTILSCHLYELEKIRSEFESDGGSRNISKLIQKLVVPVNCNRCWCAPLVELSLIWTLDYQALKNIFWL
ncbi:MAG: radical SAM protein [Candidatus Hydrogenedentes bacterium]|nr:radical SAM protein [Candidatus Hydrogenedentota bacterium]